MPEIKYEVVDKIGVVVLETDLNVQLYHALLCGLGLDHTAVGYSL